MKKISLFSILSIAILSSVAEAQKFSITIDGQKDAFYESLTGPSDGLIFISHKAYLPDMGGTPGIMPSNDKDCSAKVWFAYDTNYIYCYAEVKDDTVTADNATRYLNDCVELKLDPDPLDGTGTGTANSRVTALGVGGTANPAGVDSINNSGNLKNAAGEKWWPTGADFGRRLTSDGYAVEFRIPFDYINVPADSRFMFPREVGGVFGLAVNIGDNDAGTRDAVIQWAAGHSNDVHTNAALLGSATLLAGNKLKLVPVSPRDSTIHNDSASVWYTMPLTSVGTNPGLAGSFKLMQNYPNPFNPSTTIEFSLKNSSFVSIKIYNNLGQEVAQVLSQEMNAGVHTARWNANGFASGVYYYRISTGKFVETKKLVLFK
jgi:hypothetical protein